MRHSTRPRSRSAMRNVKRPVWSAERRLQRATSRTGPSVRSAPLAMCCILCSHGPFVYPSPPFPLSTWWRGGTTIQHFIQFVPPLHEAEWRRGGTTIWHFVPPLHEVERGPGGEVISSETAGLVPARGARPAVA